MLEYCLESLDNSIKYWNDEMWFMTPFFTVLYTCFFLMLITASVSISIAFAQTSDFQTGYSDGTQQGLSDRHSNVFRIGNICLNQSNSYCNGYLSGYLDGFFSTLPQLES
jgi:hypothetical protein